MKKAYGYCRASTGKQQLTFEAQRQGIERYYESRLKDANFEWGGFFEDKATSGGVPFTEREAGLRLFVAAQPGDAIVWTKMDRAFRSVRDGANTLHLLKEKGIAVHSIDINLDTSTALGEFVCHLLMLLGQLERSWVSSRTKEAIEARRKSGAPISRSPPAGYKRYGTGKHQSLEVDWQERLMLDSIYEDFVAGRPIEDICSSLANREIYRECGDQFGSNWLIYALHARARGYPIDYTRNHHAAYIKSLGGSKGRSCLLARLAALELETMARHPSSPEA